MPLPPGGQPFLILAASHVAGELMLSDATVPFPTREGPGVRMKDVEGNLLVDIWTVDVSCQVCILLKYN